jgi:dienelactone hydrolase
MILINVLSGLVLAFLLLTSAFGWAQTKTNAIQSTPITQSVRAFWYPSKEAKSPTLLSLHGCSGALSNTGQLSALYKEDVDRWSARGFNVMVLDSFTGRGLKSICELSTNARGDLTTVTRSGDVEAALAWLAEQPSVAVNKIILIGRSHGAQTVMTYVGDKRTGARFSVGVRPALAIAYYPGCNDPLRNPDYQITLPLLLMVGELDDWTTPQPCEKLSQRIQTQQPNSIFEFHRYAGSYHGFDSTRPVSVRGNVALTVSGKATLGGNPIAREQSHKDIDAFVQKHLPK